MGVPGLFAFLRRRYPCILSPEFSTNKAKGSHDAPQCDNLYIDANHIIHTATHVAAAREGTQLTEAQSFERMGKYLDQLMDLVQPGCLVVVAVDGVAPRAKMNQQRTRRFLSSHTAEVTGTVEKEVRREMLSEAGGKLSIPDLPRRFDANIITPGTAFMVRVAAWLRDYFKAKIQRDARFRNLKVIVSDAFEPGEGEHKIMRLIRSLKASEQYNPNTRHVIYGQDADLLLLSLLCHEPHMRIVREQMPSGPDPRKPGGAGCGGGGGAGYSNARTAPPAAPGREGGLTSLEAKAKDKCLASFEVVDVAVLRECLQWEFADYVGRPGPPDASPIPQPKNLYEVLGVQQPDDDSSDDDDEEAEDGAQGAIKSSKSSFAAEASADAAAAERTLKCDVTFERILDDLVVLTFLAGNDFLPHIPSVDIYDQPPGLDLLIAVYKELLPKLGSGLTSPNGVVHPDRLRLILQRMVRDEQHAFERRARSRRCKFEQQQQKDAQAAAELANSMDWGPWGPGAISIGELPIGADLDAFLAGGFCAPTPPPSIDLHSLSPAELSAEFARRVAERVQDRIMRGDPFSEDPCQMELKDYRGRYYTRKFERVLNGGRSMDIEGLSARVSRAYLDGIAWTYRYYCLGPSSISFEFGSSSSSSDDVQSAYGSGSKQRRQGGGAVRLGQGAGGDGADQGPQGASWTWAYPYHYAPLMSDLAKARPSAEGGSSAAGGTQRHGVFSGPIHLTRSLEDMVSCPVNAWAPVNGPVRPLLQLMCVLPPRSASAALPAELANILLMAEGMDDDSGGGGDGRRRHDVHYGYDEQDDDYSQQPFGLLSELPEGASLALGALAGRLAHAFPLDIESLVDMTGKKWLHTGVVQLPFVEPSSLARVIQEALNSGAYLTDEEEVRNRFRPADVLVDKALWEDMQTTFAALQSSACDDGPDVERSGVASACIQAELLPDAEAVWHMLATSARRSSNSRTSTSTTTGGTVGGTTSGGAAVGTNSTMSATASAALVGGLLGMLIGRRDNVPPPPDVASVVLDLAGLPLTEYRSELLAGADPPALAVKEAAWRKLETQLARTQRFTHQALGISSRGGSGRTDADGWQQQQSGREDGSGGNGFGGGGGGRGRGRGRGRGNTMGHGKRGNEQGAAFGQDAGGYGGQGRQGGAPSQRGRGRGVAHGSMGRRS